MEPEADSVRRVFACERDGLQASLAGGTLGVYDGSGRWLIHADAFLSTAEQEMVEYHEGLHHELQASSAWGLLSAMALMLSRRGVRPHTLADLFHVMTEGAREVHERFATALSATISGLEQSRQLLAGNSTYLGYLDRAIAIAPTDAPWQYRSAAMAATLRAAMGAKDVLRLLDYGFEQVSSSDLDLERDSPDRRLEAFERHAGAESWRPVFDLMNAEHPDRGGDAGDEFVRSTPESEEAFERLRVFEEEVLLPRCHDHVRTVLDACGHPTLAYTQQSDMAARLRAAVLNVDEELGRRLQLITERRPVLDDALEYDRQGVRLRDRLPIEVLAPDETLANLEAFDVDVDGTAHVLGMWLDVDVARKQFADPNRCLPDGRLVALAVRASTAEGTSVARLGLLPTEWSPRDAQDAFGADHPLLVLTTHYSLTNSDTLAQLQRVEPVFVLTDLPVAWHVDDWIRQGVDVTFTLVPLSGESAAELWLAVFKVTAAPGLYFLCIGGKNGLSLMVERLRRRHGDRLTIDPEVVRAEGAALNLVISHVATLWHVLDQDAVE